MRTGLAQGCGTNDSLDSSTLYRRAGPKAHEHSASAGIHFVPGHNRVATEEWTQTGLLDVPGRLSAWLTASEGAGHLLQLADGLRVRGRLSDPRGGISLLRTTWIRDYPQAIGKRCEESDRP